MNIHDFSDLLPVTLMEQVRLVAPQHSTVLIGGETGTGKTRLARLFHDLSNRASEPYLTVNCASFSGGAIESELFGHIRGSFAGADRDRVGKFADVGRGTLFLDDIDTLPVNVQMMMLRAIEDRVFEPVGSNRPQAFHARLIAASNRDLEADAQLGRFRGDLFYRLNVAAFSLPPLRDQKTMIVELARRFTHEFAKQNNRPIQGLSPEALEALLAHDWPGNIRELRNVIERAVAFCPRQWIGAGDLPPALQGERGKSTEQAGIGRSVSPKSSGRPEVFGESASSAPLARGVPLGTSPAHGGISIPGNVGSSVGGNATTCPPEGASLLNPVVRPLSHSTLAGTKDVAEMDAITRALAQAGNNKSLAAQSLGISRPTLYKKLRRYGLLGEGEE